MQFLWACPSCGSPLRVDTINAGRKSRCPKCQAIFTLPATDPSTAPTASPAVAKSVASKAAAPKPLQPPGATVPIVAKPASPSGPGSAVPVVARVGGRRMLPPPRKPAPDAVSKPEPASDPAAAESSFGSEGEAPADADFFSGLVDSSAVPADPATHFAPARLWRPRAAPFPKAAGLRRRARRRRIRN